mmetsp:Transcript_6252/g.9754  ORF Transcript_6252/g.9754 Transcript_6252/m.9754 type:complete len:156 (+) Transcript_6252:29-496(+)
MSSNSLGFVCEFDDEAKQAFDTFNKETNVGSALIFQLSIKTKKIQLEEKFDDVSLQELAEDLSGVMRIAVVQVGWFVPSDPTGKVVAKRILLYFCPSDTVAPLSVQRSYHLTSKTLEKDYASHYTECFQITSSEDLNEDWLKQRNYTFKKDLISE